MEVLPITESSIEVVQISPFTGKKNSLVIPMSFDKFTAAYNKWQEGELIQNAFKGLNADEREFIKTGISPKDWNDTFDAVRDDDASDSDSSEDSDDFSRN
jgi:hypothetical protein